MNILFRNFSTSEKAAFKLAFINTVPIFAGFLFLGMAYGIYMTSAGFNPLYPALMSTLIFAGSMEFLTVNLLLSTFDPLGAFLLTLMVNARHLFYGLAMLEPYNKLNGWRKSYLIFGMCDESFSINYTSNISSKTDKNSYVLCYYFKSLLLVSRFRLRRFSGLIFHTSNSRAFFCYDCTFYSYFY